MCARRSLSVYPLLYNPFDHTHTRTRTHTHTHITTTTIITTTTTTNTTHTHTHTHTPLTHTHTHHTHTHTRERERAQTCTHTSEHACLGGKIVKASSLAEIQCTDQQGFKHAWKGKAIHFSLHLHARNVNLAPFSPTRLVSCCHRCLHPPHNRPINSMRHDSPNFISHAAHFPQAFSLLRLVFCLVSPLCARACVCVCVCFVCVCVCE